MRQQLPPPRREPQRPHVDVQARPRGQDGTQADRATLKLQRLAGNAAVSSALAAARRPGVGAASVGAGATRRAVEPSVPRAKAVILPLTVQRSGPTAPTARFELDSLRIATYSDGASALRLWCAEIAAERDALTQGNVAVPAELVAAYERGLAHAELLAGGGEEPLDRGNADDMRAWHSQYVQAINSSRRAQSFAAASRAKAAADGLRETAAKLELLVPVLRDVQRARFRGGDEEGLLETADAIATVIDTGLVTKNAIEQTLEFAAELRQFARVPSASKAAIADKVTKALQVLEKINNAWAVFQLVRVGGDLLSDSKTDMEGAHKGVAGMATLMSAGGTLLKASTGFTLYSNLYIGPMTSACLKMLSKLEDMVSKSSNRTWIELGKFDLVNWSLEPGHRKMFDFMLELMLASSPSAVPTPRGDVDHYFVDNRDDFTAGVGKAGGQLPTEGWWLWKDTNPEAFKRWAFKNRDHLWGMLYGAAKVPPAGGPAF